ncbi:MAG: RNA methyltransferase [Planctomycetaceae bacterium]|nr:RNA methyltransferase [Planctomycetaceae bacterium]
MTETAATYPVTSIDDGRIGVYRNLKDRELARLEGRFIAEGEMVVRRLLASRYAAESLLVAERQLAKILPFVPQDVPVYVAPPDLLSAIIGFNFHLGIIACGRRGEGPALDEAVVGLPPHATAVVLSEITKPDNMGALLRISSAFGADVVIAGQDCCDAFYRESIRVSMGTIFSLNLVRSPDLPADVARLKAAHGFETVGAVLAEGAVPLAQARRSPRTALMFGNEAQGLRPGLADLCDRKVVIPMQLGTDSLNVAVAAAVFLYHYTQVEDAGEMPATR